MTARRSPLDAAIPLLVVGLQLAAAVVVLGPPDVAAGWKFLTGTAPTMAGSVAAAQLLLWAALLLALAGAALAAISRAVSAVQTAGRSAVWSAAVVLVGLFILAAGAGHRSAAGAVHLDGGSVQEARSQLGP